MKVRLENLLQSLKSTDQACVCGLCVGVFFSMDQTTRHRSLTLNETHFSAANDGLYQYD